MQCGFLGEGIKTVLPHRASAKLSSRLVPDQAPQEVLDKVRMCMAAVRRVFLASGAAESLRP